MNSETTWTSNYRSESLSHLKMIPDMRRVSNNHLQCILTDDLHEHGKAAIRSRDESKNHKTNKLVLTEIKVGTALSNGWLHPCRAIISSEDSDGEDSETIFLTIVEIANSKTANFQVFESNQTCSSTELCSLASPVRFGAGSQRGSFCVRVIQ